MTVTAWRPNQIADRAVESADSWAWRVRARCRTEDPAIFFHPDGERGNARKEREQQAKQICAACPVTQQCREHSLRYEESFGVWGGLSETERSELLPERAVNVRTHRGGRKRA